MKTIRRLAFLALTGLATTTAFAGPPPENNKPVANETAYNAPTTFTDSDLERLLKAGYDNVESIGKGANACFLLNKIRFTPKTSLKPYDWSVSITLNQRAHKQAHVRVYFPCQRVPADASSERLQELMDVGGVLKSSPANFVIGGKGKDRMLYLVTDVSTLDLTTAKLKEDITLLFESAHESRYVWDVDLNKPQLKAEKNELVGYWHCREKSTYFPSSPSDCLSAFTFAKDGTCKWTVPSGGPISQSTEAGTYTIDGTVLTITRAGSKTGETHTFVVKDGKLTIMPEKDDRDNVVIKTSTFYLWE